MAVKLNGMQNIGSALARGTSQLSNIVGKSMVEQAKPTLLERENIARSKLKDMADSNAISPDDKSQLGLLSSYYANPRMDPRRSAFMHAAKNQGLSTSALAEAAMGRAPQYNQVGGKVFIDRPGSESEAVSYRQGGLNDSGQPDQESSFGSSSDVMNLPGVNRALRGGGQKFRGGFERVGEPVLLEGRDLDKTARTFKRSNHGGAGELISDLMRSQQAVVTKQDTTTSFNGLETPGNEYITIEPDKGTERAKGFQEIHALKLKDPEGNTAYVPPHILAAEGNYDWLRMNTVGKGTLDRLREKANKYYKKALSGYSIEKKPTPKKPTPKKPAPKKPAPKKQNDDGDNDANGVF